MNGPNTEYRVLGYTSSEVERTAQPFLVVLKIDGRLRGYVLSDWQLVLGCTDVLTAMYIDEDIMQAIGSQCDGWQEEMEDFFRTISDLCVGPVRTLSFGSFAGGEPRIEEENFSGQAVLECSQQAILSLVSTLEGLYLIGEEQPSASTELDR